MCALAGAPARLRGAQSIEQELDGVVKSHVAIAELSRGKRKLWGRIGGSAEERASATLLSTQMRPYCNANLEPVRYSSERVFDWSVLLNGLDIESAVPAPHDARFPDGVLKADVVVVAPDGDWAPARGKWAFLAATWDGAAGANLVRQKNLYQKAVEAGAAGFVFSLPTGPGLVRVVPPVDKAFADLDTRYPKQKRPIPCFCVSEDDGKRIAAGGMLAGSIVAEQDIRREGRNVVGLVKGQGKFAVVMLAHLDAFFGGANDNASGLATLVGIAKRLSAVHRAKRFADVYLVGQSSHHEGGRGTRAFLAADAKRTAAIQQAYAVEHVDAAGGANEFRRIFLGSKGWPEARAMAPGLVRDVGLMKADVEVADACISDLFVVCKDPRTAAAKVFSLIGSPPYYHTEADTTEKVDARGVVRAVEFHLRMLRATGAIGS